MRARLRPSSSGASARRGRARSASSRVLHPPICDMVRSGCTKPSSLTWCLSSFSHTAARMIALELVVGRPGAQRAAQVGLGHREQAGAQLALGGHPDPVAVAAEGLADRRDEADRALAVGELPAPRRAVALAAHVLERIGGVDQPPHLGVGQHAVARPRAVGVERHELDEADLVRVLAGELGEAHDLVLGEVLQRDHVDLDRAQLGVLLGRREPFEHLLERVAAGELEEAVGRQRVERDVDAPQAGGHELLDLAAEQVAVGRQREVVDVLVRAQQLDELPQLAARERLAAGQADVVHAHARQQRRRAARSPRS